MVQWAPSRWSFLACCVLVVVTPSVVAHAGEEGAPPEPDVLWVGARSVMWADWSNFTTRLPQGEGYVQEPEEHPERGTWSWRTTRVPADWSIPAGTELRLVVTVSGMEKTWPLPLPLGNGTEPFATSFEAEALRLGANGSGVFAMGHVVVPMDPVHPPEGPLQVVIPMPVEEDVVLGPEDRFEVQLHVYARGVKFNSMRVHTGGEETASHVVVPGFPVAAFRAWEDGFPHDLCLWYRSEGEACPTALHAGPGSPEPVRQEADTQESPVFAGGWLVAVGVAWALHRRRLVAPYNAHFTGRFDDGAANAISGEGDSPAGRT